MRRNAARSVRGFSLIELVLVIAIAATLAGISIPIFTEMSDAAKLSDAAHGVERELQTARLRAVSTNTTIRVRTNCPSTGYYRTVEVLGTAADTTTTRCDPSTYRYPASDTDLATTPNFDGPVRQLLNDATVTTASLEFRPDGTAWNATTGTAVSLATSSMTLTVTREGKTKTITVNGLGKVLLQ